MARIKITNKTIQAKLQKWAQGQELTDELIFYANEIDPSEVKLKSWELAAMIVDVRPDEIVIAGDPVTTINVSGFSKIVYVQKL